MIDWENRGLIVDRKGLTNFQLTDHIPVELITENLEDAKRRLQDIQNVTENWSRK